MGRLLLFTTILLLAPVPGRAQTWEISAIRYGEIEGFPLSGLIPDAPEGQAVDIALAFWMIRDPDRVVLFDSGFFRDDWLDRFDVTGYVRPDQALARAGVRAEEVTDIVISHAHWDHVGGVELFPEATVWIQAEEYRYYTGPAWQEGGRTGGIDKADVLHLVERNLAGQLRLVDGGGVEILPGLIVHTGARHTYASQFLEVRGKPTYVLASDNAYLYLNLREHRAGATFSAADREANVRALDRMLTLAGDTLHVIPGHDAELFRRFPSVVPGVVRIRH